MARYLVTGGAGFIGSHLTDALLVQGHEVRAVDDMSTGRLENLDPRAELIKGDVADAELMQIAMQGVAGCFHLAAIASVARCTEDWVATHRTNLGGTVAVMDAARRHGNVPVVYASSAAVYGAQHMLPISENAVTAPRSSYGADKLGCELQASAALTVHGLSSFGFRFFNVFGPRQDPSSPYSGVISVFADRLRAGRTITIHGDGGQSRDFIYVADIVGFLLAGMTAAADMPQACVLNACTGQTTTIIDLAYLLANTIGTVPTIVHGQTRVGDIRESVGDPVRAEQVLGLRAKVSLADGLRDMFPSRIEERHAA